MDECQLVRMYDFLRLAPITIVHMARRLRETGPHDNRDHLRATHAERWRANRNAKLDDVDWNAIWLESVPRQAGLAATFRAHRRR